MKSITGESNTPDIIRAKWAIEKLLTYQLPQEAQHEAVIALESLNRVLDNTEITT
jgi:hypothetical protein